MSKMILNGEVCSGSTSYASAIEYIKEDGTKTTVQNELSEQNKNFKWKNLGTVMGGAEMNLPDEYTELYVKTASNKDWHNSTFYFIKDDLKDTDQYFINGYYVNISVTSFIRVKINKSKVALNQIYENGTDTTNSASMTVYYR